MLGIVRYVRKHLPRIVVLENVKGLVARHGDVLDNVMDSFAALGYVVYWRLLGMRIHGGFPCRRSRVYIVAIFRPATGGQPATGGISQPVVQWPEPVCCADLSAIFDDDDRLPDYSNYPLDCVNGVGLRNLVAAAERVTALGRRCSRDPTDFSVVADLGGSAVQVGVRIAPCLTKSRGATRSFWSIQHGRRLTVREMCRLQGLDPDWLNMSATPSQMGALLGNGYACTVIARVVAAAIQAVEGEASNSGPATGGPQPATGGPQPATGGSVPATGGSVPATTGDQTTSDAGGEDVSAPRLKHRRVHRCVS